MNVKTFPDVLLLNVTYEALEEISYERAIVLLVTGAAETVELAQPYREVRSRNLAIPLPRTIVMKRYVLVNYEVLVTDTSNASFPAVLRRDKSRCAYCGEYASTVDHVFPKSRGGGNNWGNLVAACFSCNNRKADRTPEEAGMKLLFLPRVPRGSSKAQNRIWKEVAPT